MLQTHRIVADKTENASSFYVIAVVVYNFTFEKDRHCTALAYSVRRKDGRPVFPLEADAIAVGDKKYPGVPARELEWNAIDSMGVGVYAD